MRKYEMQTRSSERSQPVNRREKKRRRRNDGQRRQVDDMCANEQKYYTRIALAQLHR